MEILPQLRCFLGNDFFPHVITEWILTSQLARFSRGEGGVWHAGNEIALYQKEKVWRIALNSMTHVEEVEELEGKKSSFEDILVFFFSEKIW